MLFLLHCLYTIFFFPFLLILFSTFFFFFSSRRRHTRSDRDWSSDVCSSDLDPGGEDGLGARRRPADVTAGFEGHDQGATARAVACGAQRLDLGVGTTGQIGRASCRERV